MFIRAKPFNLACPIEFLIYVFKRLNVENDRSPFAVVTGRVIKFFNNLCMCGNIIMSHSSNTLRALVETSHYTFLAINIIL